ncbi:sialidase family protein [Sulfidibacter corallicola]|uniref:DUF6242 domain-containing protein n=1 Tax=Sulfidibacter corallicola TaxID=2818388 RepID=A0A8A4TK23_SULCO|nr:hypothetical protein [Sulfidibacter corallicola]QTD50286.1 hypothetical protein J3U87_32275 [Sulfidibacter corallicola]
MTPKPLPSQARLARIALPFALLISTLFAQNGWQHHSLGGEIQGYAAGDQGYVAISRWLFPEHRIWFSADGFQWNRAFSVNQTLHAVARSGQTYVVSTDEGSFVSENGIDWQAGSTDIANAAQLVWDGERFLARIDTPEPQILTADTAGRQWTALPKPPGQVASMASDGEEIAVIVDRLLHTYDDANGWTLVPGQEGRAVWQSVVRGGARFLAVGSGGQVATTDADRDWTFASTNLGTDAHHLVWDGARFVVGNRWRGLLASTDGTQWQGLPLATPFLLQGIWHAGDRFLLEDNEGRLLTSEDATTWLRLAPRLPISGLRHKVAGSRLFFLNRDLTHTRDGLHWNQVVVANADITFSFNDVAWNGQAFVAVGNFSKVYRSIDGTAWENVSLSGRQDLRWVCHAAGLFWILDGEGHLYSSSTGDAWRVHGQVAKAEAVMFAENDEVILLDNDHVRVFRDGAWHRFHGHQPKPLAPLSNGNGFAGLSDNRIVVSRTGHHWSEGTHPFDNQEITSLAVQDDRYLALTWQSLYLSRNGISWQAVAKPDLPFTPIWLGAIGDTGIAVSNDDGTIAWGDLDTSLATAATAAAVIPWVVNNTQWSSRVSLFNSGDEEVDLTLRAVTTDGQTRETEVSCPPHSVTVISGADLFPDISGYSLLLFGDTRRIRTSFLTFNLEPESGGSSPSQTTGQQVESLTSKALFGYLPGDGIAAIVLVNPQEGVPSTPVLLEYLKDGVRMVTEEITLVGNQPTATIIDAFGDEPLDPQSHYAIRAVSRNGAPIAGTTFVFNQRRQPSMAAAIPLEEQE